MTRRQTLSRLTAPEIGLRLFGDPLFGNPLFGNEQQYASVEPQPPEENARLRVIFPTKADFRQAALWMTMRRKGQNGCQAIPCFL